MPSLALPLIKLPAPGSARPDDCTCRQLLDRATADVDTGSVIADRELARAIGTDVIA